MAPGALRLADPASPTLSGIYTAAQNPNPTPGSPNPIQPQTFAAGGTADSLPLGPIGSTGGGGGGNFSPAAPPIDPALAGSLATPGANSGGGVINTSDNVNNVNPAANAIQPVNAPGANTQTITPVQNAVAQTQTPATQPVAAAPAQTQAAPASAPAIPETDPNL